MKKNLILKAFIFFFALIILSVIAYTIIDNLPPKLSKQEKAYMFVRKILNDTEAEITAQSESVILATVSHNWSIDRFKRQIENMVRNYSDLSYLTRCKSEENNYFESKSIVCNLITDDEVLIYISFQERKRSENSKNSLNISWKELN
jgi:hypothetical protein